MGNLDPEGDPAETITTSGSPATRSYFMIGGKESALAWAEVTQAGSAANDKEMVAAEEAGKQETDLFSRVELLAARTETLWFAEDAEMVLEASSVWWALPPEWLQCEPVPQTME